MTAKDEDNIAMQAGEVSEASVEPGQRVELKAPLEGHYILVDVDAITFGMIEDIQVGQAKLVLDHLSRVIVGGDLVHGDEAERREQLRKLRPREMAPMIIGVTAALSLPNGS